MTLLTEHVPLLAGATEGIKKLRELILELAVRGKLVPQDPDDEPASELLKRIVEEKARLVVEGKIKKAKAGESEIAEVTYPIPSTWIAAQLGQVVEIVRGITFPASEKSKLPERGRVACLRTSNVQNEIEWDDLLYIRENFVSRPDQYVQPHDIVMSMANSRELVGKVALVGPTLDQATTFGGFLGVIRPVLIEPEFVMALLRTPAARRCLIDSASQTTNIANVSLAKLRPLPFAIPPLGEQYRIVAKIDELMALCDTLESQQANAESAHTKLVNALLDSLIQAGDAADFATRWQRLSEYFDTLFTTEASIDALKQAVLQLAVMGKLVPQDTSEEPASELLKRIAEEKNQLVKTGVIRRQKALPAIPHEEKPFELPIGWAWSRFGDLTIDSYTGIDRGKALQGTHLKYPYFKMSNILNKGGYETFDMARVDASPEEVQRYKLCSGDLLFNTRNSRELVGKTCVISQLPETIVLYNNNILRCKFPKGVHAELVDYWLRSAAGLKLLNSIKSNTTNVCAIYQGKLFEVLCPVMPSAEQQRIVAKVDQLMSLCDQLKSRIGQARDLHQKLAITLVERAVA